MTDLRIQPASIEWNDSGTPVSSAFDDVYFSNANGLEETRYVFLKQNALPERWETFGKRRFVIAETGFGTGLNFMAVWQMFEAYRLQHPDSATKELHFISFEKFPVKPADLQKAHQAWPELKAYAEALQQAYPPAVSGCHRLVLAGGMITLDLWIGDIKDSMPQIACPYEGVVDCWFLDGFAPSKNPEMWNQDLFNGMARLSKNSSTLATFTAAGFVRRGLMDAGFTMGKAKGFGRKRELLIGKMENRQSQSNMAPWYLRKPAENTGNIAIIGGGIASATTAYALAQRGIRSTLYCEDKEAATGASGNRQGAVYPLLNGSHDALSRFFAPAFVFARQFVEQIAQKATFDHDWCGVTQIAWDEKIATKLEKMLSGGFPAEILRPLSEAETDEALGLPSGFTGVSYPLGGWLCPQQLTRAILSLAENTGLLDIKYQSDVSTLTRQSNEWQLSVGDSTFAHPCVVVANGHKFSGFEQTAPLPAYSVRGQVSHIKTTETLKKLKSVVCFDGYLTPANPETGTHCIGASYSRNDESLAFRFEDQGDNKQRLLNCIKQEWTQDVNTDNEEGRVGIRCASRDHLPFAGDVADFPQLHESYRDLHLKKTESENVPVYEGLYCLLALGSRGLTSAPILGELIASQICGDPLPMEKDVLDALHPARMWVRKALKSGLAN